MVPKSKAGAAAHKCSFCSRRSRFKCGACQIARYCSSECQRADREEHKKYCLGTDDGQLACVACAPSGASVRAGRPSDIGAVAFPEDSAELASK